MGYDEQYAKTEALFGQEPEESLQNFGDDLDPRLPVLDVGSGQGRNAFYLANKGLTVHALDPSRVGTRGLEQKARQENYTIKVINQTFTDFVPETSSYGGILRLFKPWAAIHHWEGQGPVHRHGVGPLERHAKFEVIFRTD